MDEIIFAYTRAQATEDGVLIDISKLAVEMVSTSCGHHAGGLGRYYRCP